MTRAERLQLAYVVTALAALLAFALMGAAPVASLVAGVAVGANLSDVLRAWSRRKPAPRPPEPAPEPRLEIRAPWWAAR